MITSDKTFDSINDFNSALIPNPDGDKLSVLVFNRRRKRFKKLKFSPEVEEIIQFKEIGKKDVLSKMDERMRLLFKRVEENEKMPELFEGLIRSPTLEELKAPPKIYPEINIGINAPLLNIDGSKIEGGKGLPGINIKGLK